MEGFDINIHHLQSALVNAASQTASLAFSYAYDRAAIPADIERLRATIQRAETYLDKFAEQQARRSNPTLL